MNIKQDELAALGELLACWDQHYPDEIKTAKQVLADPLLRPMLLRMAGNRGPRISPARLLHRYFMRRVKNGAVADVVEIGGGVFSEWFNDS